MMVWLLACVAIDTPLCSPGTIKLGSTGEEYQRLESALEAADYTDGICIGEGTWILDSPVQLQGSEGDEGRWIDIFGAGSDKTLLQAETLSRLEVRFDMGTGATHAALRGLTLENIGALTVAGEIELEDVVSRSDRLDAGLVAQGYAVTVTNVRSSGHRWMHQDGVAMRARERLTIEDLVVEDNEVGANFPMVLDAVAEVDWEGGSVEANVNTAGMPTDRFLTLRGVVSMHDVDLSSNDVAGSLIAVDEGTELDTVRVGKNVVGGDHVISGPGTGWEMRGGRVTNNEARVSALGIYGEGLLTLSRVNLSNPDSPCEVAGGTSCLQVTGGPDVSAVCSSSACTTQD